MPTLRFANLGVTPGDDTVSVIGNLYLLMTDDSAIALVFDLRRYIAHPPSDEYKVRFKEIKDSQGNFQIAILPKSRLRAKKKGYKCNGPFQTPSENDALKKAKKVFVVNLTGEEPAKVGWWHLERMFSNATIVNIPRGQTNWRTTSEEERNQNLIESIEATELTRRDERIKVDPFTLFFFEDKENRSMNVLIAGESLNRPFAIFIGNEKFREFFDRDEINTEPIRMRTLSAGTWFAFYHLSTTSVLAC